MDVPNIGPYASVIGLEQSTKRIAYKRGYGNILVSTIKANQVNTAATPFNRLQPLCGQFGTHLPTSADPAVIMSNPQTTLAWDNTQPVFACQPQNYNIDRLPIADDTKPMIEFNMQGQGNGKTR